MTYVLHYAPDNASLIIRLALEQRGLAYRTALVDRTTSEHKSPAFRAMNPSGQIPVLETPTGPISETGAIVLYLADRHGGLGPAADAPERGAFLKWLFFTANTLHPTLRMVFYPDQYAAEDIHPALRQGLTKNLSRNFALIDAYLQSTPGFEQPTVTDFYLVCLLRWAALYPVNMDRAWFVLDHYPALAALCTRIEDLPATRRLQKAEGLGNTPFTAPQHPNPPEGSAT